MKMTWWKNEINLALKFYITELKKQPTKFDYDYENGRTFQQTLSEKTDHNFTKKGRKCDGLELVLIFWPHHLKVIWIFPPREILMSDARCLDVDACVAPAIMWIVFIGKHDCVLVTSENWFIIEGLLFEVAIASSIARRVWHWSDLLFHRDVTHSHRVKVSLLFGPLTVCF